MDWSKTPLGSIEQWPQSLKSSVTLILESQFPAAIYWSPKLIAVYNDTYKLLLGARPETLGWIMPDILYDVWDTLHPTVEKAMAGEASYFQDAPLTILRYGYPEKAWFDYDISPLRDETGAIAGVLVTVVETTEKVRAEQDLRRLAERAQKVEAIIRRSETILKQAGRMAHFGGWEVEFLQLEDIQKIRYIGWVMKHTRFSVMLPVPSTRHSIW